MEAGLRDRAILLLLSRLGLRAGDILRLRPSDVDWKEGTLHVVGKGRRQTLLPMTQEVGDGLVAYIKDGRHPAAYHCGRRQHPPYAHGWQFGAPAVHLNYSLTPP